MAPVLQPEKNWSAVDIGGMGEEQEREENGHFKLPRHLHSLRRPNRTGLAAFSGDLRYNPFLYMLLSSSRN